MTDRPHLAPRRRPQREWHTDSLTARGSASDSGLGTSLTGHGGGSGSPAGAGLNSRRSRVPPHHGPGLPCPERLS